MILGSSFFLGVKRWGWWNLPSNKVKIVSEWLWCATSQLQTCTVKEIVLPSLLTCLSFNKASHLRLLHHLFGSSPSNTAQTGLCEQECPHVHHTYLRVAEKDRTDHYSLSCCPLFNLEIRQEWLNLPPLPLGRKICWAHTAQACRHQQQNEPGTVAN